MLTQLDQLAALIAQCDVRILEVSQPFEPEIQRSKVVNKKKPKPHITPEEFARLVSLVDEPYATMMYVAVFTGLRVSELVGLKWEDVHEDAITVDERFCRGDWSVTKTAGSAATIGVAPSIIARIRRLKSMEVEINWGGKGAKKRFKLVRSNGPKDLVFQSLRSGAPISDGNVMRRHLRPAALKLGIDPKKATWRSLRTSCATWMIEAGRKPEGRARTDAARSHRHDDGHLRKTRVRKSAAGSDTYYGNGGNATGSAGAVARQDDQLSNNWNELERDCQK
jgi:integrase